MSSQLEGALDCVHALATSCDRIVETVFVPCALASTVSAPPALKVDVRRRGKATKQDNLQKSSSALCEPCMRQGWPGLPLNPRLSICGHEVSTPRSDRHCPLARRNVPLKRSICRTVRATYADLGPHQRANLERPIPYVTAEPQSAGGHVDTALITSPVPCGGQDERDHPSSHI